MGKRKTCKKLCKKSYIKEHIRLLKANNQNIPDKQTRKLIYKDCKKRMCNPGCKNTLYKNKNISFHPDYSSEDILHLKRNGALSWCAQKFIGKNQFNIRNIIRKSSKSSNNRKGGTRKKKHNNK
jgi:hypothetical protein